jgi:hypothetical protein
MTLRRWRELASGPAIWMRAQGNQRLFGWNAMNSIANLKIVNAESPEGPVPVIVMGLNIGDEERADEFVHEVVEKFKAQRMCSPPTTAAMLITIITAMPLKRFVDRWNELARNDKILGFFMSQMRMADVLRGTTAGVTLEQASLVTPAG